MNVLIAPDSFKGSLQASEVACAIGDALTTLSPKLTLTLCPISDGGDGMIDVLKQLKNTTEKTMMVHSADMTLRQASYLLHGTTAYIEMAQCSGLNTINLNQTNALKTTTYGVGEMVLDTLKYKVKTIVVGLGGSATNDGGIGLLDALGYKMLDKANRILSPVGENLEKIHTIDDTNAFKFPKDVTIKIITDVNTPLYGATGAAKIFGPQKGLNNEEINRLDLGLQHYASIIKAHTQKDFSHIKGCGAAGGLSIAFLAFLHATIEPGIDYIFKILQIEDLIKSHDIIITAEGKIDQQTHHDKAPLGVINLANKHRKKIMVLGGQITENVTPLNVDLMRAIHPKSLKIEQMLDPLTTKIHIKKTLYSLKSFFINNDPY